MTQKNVANKDLTIEAEETLVSADFLVTTPESQNVKANGKGVYSGGIGISITNATDGTCTQSGPPVLSTIEKTATETKADGKFVNRLGDKSPTLSIPGVLSGGGACTISLTAVVSDAGQDKVIAE